MDFVWGVIESVTANIFSIIVAYVVYRHFTTRSNTLSEFARDKTRPWLAAWVPYGDDTSGWVTELITIDTIFLLRSFYICSKPIKSNDGTQITHGDNATPMYHWQARVTLTADGIIFGTWNSLLLPKKYKGQIYLEVKWLSVLVGTFQASTTGVKFWSGPLIICRTVEEMERALKEYIDDEIILSRMVNNFKLLERS